MSSFRSFCSHFHYLSPSRLRYLFQQSPVDRQRDVRKTLFSLASPRPTEVEDRPRVQLETDVKEASAAVNCVVGGRSDEEVGRGERGGGHERTHMVIDEREKGSHQIRQ